MAEQVLVLLNLTPGSMDETARVELSLEVTRAVRDAEGAILELIPRSTVALSVAGVDPRRVFSDKLSGSAKTGRPGLVAMLDYARAADTDVVAGIDRLGRSVAEVTRTIAELGERGIVLCALREDVDTATPTARAIAAIMATLAELELEFIRTRTPRRLPRVTPCATLAGY